MDRIPGNRIRRQWYRIECSFTGKLRRMGLGLFETRYFDDAIVLLRLGPIQARETGVQKGNSRWSDHIDRILLVLNLKRSTILKESY